MPAETITHDKEDEDGELMRILDLEGSTQVGRGKIMSRAFEQEATTIPETSNFSPDLHEEEEE